MPEWRFKRGAKSYKEYHVRDAFRLYQEKMHEDEFKHGYFIATVRAPAQQELNIAEWVSAYNAGNLGRIVCIDERDKTSHVEGLLQKCSQVSLKSI